MISEQDKKAILDGAYGITRNGRKVRFIGYSKQESLELTFVSLPEDKISYYCPQSDIGFLYVNKDSFKTIPSTMEDHGNDVVGLWKNRLETFDLEKALGGEPVMLRNGSKAIILKRVKDTLIGYFDECSPFAWELNGDADRAADSNHDIINMWKEPEPVSNTVTVTLPCPLKEPMDGMYYLNECGVFKAYYGKEMCEDVFRKKVYFGSEKDAKAWFNAMQDSRK